MVSVDTDTGQRVRRTVPAATAEELDREADSLRGMAAWAGAFGKGG